MALDPNRKTAYGVLQDVEEKGTYSNLALNQRISSEHPPAPGFVRELVYGVLKHQTLLDYLMDHYLKTPSSRMGNRERTLLRMGFYQLEFMNSVPPYAAAFETVQLAKKVCRGREGLINAVLRNHLRRKEPLPLPERAGNETEYLSVAYSYQPWIVRLWEKEYPGAALEALLAAGNHTPRLSIRVNALRTTREELKAGLLELGFTAEESRLSPAGLLVSGENILASSFYKQGYFSVQDEASMMAVELLDPKPGETVIDACAAPGGKALYMAERMENRGHILAGDLYPTRLTLVQREGERLGVSIVETEKRDALLADSERREMADRVLVDAPCSGLGVIRRKPEIKYKKWDEDLARLPEKQLAILRAQAGCVRLGGTLVYSTCTIARRENEEVASAFLKSAPSFIMEESRQLLPSVDGTDGFFMVKFVRTLDGEG